MEDIEYLRILRSAIDTGVIEVRLNLSKLEHMDSPISVDADSNIWIYVLMFSVGLTWMFAGFVWACVAAAIAAIVWFTIGLPWHRRRMKERFYRSVLFDPGEWRKLWQFTGVEMIAASTSGRCLSPDGNWRQFIAAALPHSRSAPD